MSLSHADSVSLFLLCLWIFAHTRHYVMTPHHFSGSQWAFGGVTTDVRTTGQHTAKVTLFRWNLCIFDYLSKPDVYYGRIHQNMMNKTESLTPKLKTFL